MDRNGGLGVDRTHDLRIMRATLTAWLSYKSFERFLSTNRSFVVFKFYYDIPRQSYGSE